MRRYTGEGFAGWLAARRSRGGFAPPEVEEAVAGILAEVRNGGDLALCGLTERFDRVRLAPEALEVSSQEREAARSRVDAAVLAALRTARDRIEAYHRRQLPHGFRFEEASGNILGQAVRPLRRVGIYVPGGRASYPSSVLMGAVPARLAGVREVVMCTPPGPGGAVDPAVLAAADVAGVDRVFRVGGAQAVAALAYGTETVPRVDKIVGPGNIYVTVAKRQVFGTVAIDGLHGPSEVAVVADDSADPAWVAADLLAQAEHDPLAAAVLLTPSENLAARVGEELERQLAAASRADIARRSLAEQGALVITSSLAEAVDLANSLAPEHLQLEVADPLAWLERVDCAGAVFLGHFAPVPAGDYAAGTNHVLPTGGTARFFSGLGVHDFVRTFGYFYGTAAGLADWGPASRVLAEREGLAGHAAAVKMRLRAAGVAEATDSAEAAGLTAVAGAAADTAETAEDTAETAADGRGTEGTRA